MNIGGRRQTEIKQSSEIKSTISTKLNWPGGRGLYVDSTSNFSPSIPGSTLGVPNFVKNLIRPRFINCTQLVQILIADPTNLVLVSGKLALQKNEN